MIDRILLFPYTITLALRDRLYREGKLKSVSAEVPTISVGNITVGGTGKTPHTEMILRLLLDSDRWGYSNIAVLSRGYKRKTKGFRKVLRDGTAANFGDEPLQIAKKFPSVTVAVDKDRVEGCRLLVHPEGVAELPPSDVIILDDAFQYRKLRPTLSIVLVDYSRPIHKDRLLPFGGLRDLPSRIADADIVIVTKCPSYLDEWERGKWADYLGISSYSTASCRGRSARGREQLLLFSTIAYSGMEPVYETADSRFTYSPRAILFSGIAKDEPLRDYISDKNKIVRRFSPVSVHDPADVHPQGFDLASSLLRAQQRRVGELALIFVLLPVQQVVGHLKQQAQFVRKGSDISGVLRVAAAPVRTGQAGRAKEGAGLMIVYPLQGRKVPDGHVEIQALARRHLQRTLEDGFLGRFLARHVAQKPHGHGEEPVSGQDGVGLPEDLVIAGLAPAHVVVVHGGQVVMDKGIGVDHLEGAREGQGVLITSAHELAARET